MTLAARLREPAVSSHDRLVPELTYQKMVAVIEAAQKMIDASPQHEIIGHTVPISGQGVVRLLQELAALRAAVEQQEQT